MITVCLVETLDGQVSAAAAELCIIWLFAKYDINCFNMIVIVVMKEMEKKLVHLFHSIIF